VSKSVFVKNNWILSPRFDLFWILGPSFFSVLFCVLFSSVFLAHDELPIEYWFVFVLACDVAHVYSTLYRTYFVKQEREKYGALLLYIPLFCFMFGIFLYSIHFGLFWRILAYIAVFHFIRQQYGFVQIYSKIQKRSRAQIIIDKLTIYTVTLYPLLYWHTSERHFHWFVDGDFVQLPWPLLKSLGEVFYYLVGSVYLLSEGYHFLRFKQINIQKNLVIFGTALVWNVGIIFYNNDTIFTITNVVAHGIPYMALIWSYGRHQNYKFKVGSFVYGSLFTSSLVPLFLGGILILAYLEEGLWAHLVWREKQTLFQVFQPLQVFYNPSWHRWVVPALMVPQFTHYLLDGYIWKSKSPGHKGLG
jgi:hypothetical protein